MNTVTRAQLAETIYAQVGLSRNDSADLLETVLERVSTALETGDSVKIEVPILPRRVLTFRPSQVLKAHVNGTALPTGADAADDGDVA